MESVKRFMGTDTQWEFDGRLYSPADISALIFRKLKRDAEYRLGRSVLDCVISTPAYFAHQERQATKERLCCGLACTVFLIVNEPTAAAIAFRLERSAGAETVLVYDLGGGTFDVTLLEISTAGIQVLATDGDVRLGGKDWDALLIDFVAQQFLAQHGVDPREDTDAYQSLVLEAEAAKRSLSECRAVRIACSIASKRLQVPVSREQFEQLSLPLLERTRSTVNLVLNRLGRTPQDVGRVLLVGGSTRMPMVRQMLGQMFPQRVDATIHPDECVAIGAGIEAARQSLASLPRRPTGEPPASQPQPDGHVGPRHHGPQLGYRGAQGWHAQDEHHPSQGPPIPAAGTRGDYETTRRRPGESDRSRAARRVRGPAAEPALGLLRVHGDSPHRKAVAAGSRLPLRRQRPGGSQGAGCEVRPDADPPDPAAGQHR